MDSDLLRRKRKRLSKLTISISSARSLLLFASFLFLLYLSSRHISLFPAPFHPVILVPKLPLLTSPHSRARLSSDSIRTRLRIESRVSFPDHVLLILSNRGLIGSELNCVYNEFESIVKLKRKVLSVDEYNEFESIVKCPIPPSGYSQWVNLEMKSQGGTNFSDEEFGGFNRTAVVVSSWDKLAYTAALDGKTALVFVKGLNLRGGRESDPSQLSCHFGFGNLEMEGKYVLTTKAITAAQEVVRCQLPRSVQTNPNMAQGIRITVGLAQRHSRVLVPSVAKILITKSRINVDKIRDKRKLCVCTMVWNQASALREWVTYHSWLGVEKWFIYDNNSDDGIGKVVDELELENYNISRHVWPWIKTQEAGFSHCALRARDECTWVGFMDVDEYFYFQNQGRNALKTLVSNYSTTNIAEIRTACHSFGPSGLSKPPLQGVMIGYTCRLQSPERHKSIIRPEALDVSLLNVVHHFRMKRGFGYMNLPQNIAVINHYKYQVWESFRAKFYRRVATYVADWQENQNEGSRDRAPGLGTEAIEPMNWRLRFCEVWDTGLRDFVKAHLADPVTGSVPWERSSL